MDPRDRRVAQWLLQRHPAIADADDPSALGAHRQYILGQPIVGNRGQTNYAAAKAGLHGATRSLALELASRGITVNTVAPGIIASPMAAAAFGPDQIDRLVPMKRAGTVDEVAELVGFLASDLAGYITAQIISINGGMA